MAKKNKAEKPPREFTKRQLSRWQRQKKRQRITSITGITILAAVIIILIFGWYNSMFRPLNQTAIMVNETKFNMKYYIEMLKLSGQGQPVEYLQYITDRVTNDIEQNELIRQGAANLGISVSDDEVKAKLKEADLPAGTGYNELVENRLLLEKLIIEHFDWQVPQSADQVKTMVMLLESEDQANKVRTRLENGASFTELAGELSLDESSKGINGDLGWHPRNILADLQGTAVPAEFAFSAEAGALSQPLYDEGISKAVGYWLIKILERNEEDGTIRAQTMILGSEDEARDVRARLEAGEHFTALAREFSNLPGAEENGGDYKNLARETMNPVFDEFAFNADIKLETLSEPIRDETVFTKGGYWLVKVVDKAADRQIEQSDRDSMQARALDEWVTSLWDDPKNEVNDSFLDEEKIAWAIEQASRN